MVYHDPISATLWDHAPEERLRGMQSRLALCLIPVAVIAATVAQQSTTEPSWAPTGKLSQFRGFVTPRINRQLPSNAQFMYASVWAAWSAWSFCNNGVRIRVRACNTVKGFNCLGPNQETRPCETNSFHNDHSEQKVHNDYDVIDPYEADRKEAMKQLYPDEIPENSQENSNFIKLSKGGFRTHSAGHNTRKFFMKVVGTAVQKRKVDRRALNIRIGKSIEDIFGWVENPDYDWDVLNAMYNGRPSMSIRKLDQGVQPIKNEDIEDLDLLGSNYNEISSFLNFTTTKAVPITLKSYRP